jgi:hypothetical protein
MAETLRPMSLGEFLDRTLPAAILPVAFSLFYYDQRIRHEGYDIEQMMVSAGLNPTATAAVDDSLAHRAASPEPLPVAPEDNA